LTNGRAASDDERAMQTITFPAGRAEKRRVLLEAVERVADTVRAHAGESDTLGTLAPPVVEALSTAGLFRLKLPAELGGAEADPVTQMEVIEAATRLDTSAGWAVMIGATSIGWPGAFLPDEGVVRVFKGGRVPTCAGVGGVTGTAQRVEGGYILNGRFQYASGIRHAEWLIAGARIARDDGEAPEERFFVFPLEDATVHEDSWEVAGLKGSGSHDFSAEDLFVPEEMTWDRGIMSRGEPRRGGAIFRLGMPAFTANEHGAFGLGAGTRALELVIEIARSKKRGHGAMAMSIAERPVFQRVVALADIRLRSARALLTEVLERCYERASDGEVPDATLQAEVRAASVYSAQTGAEVATECFRYAGGSALQLSNPLQRYWRDATAGAQHMAASDIGYEGYGQSLLGLAAAVRQER
jgi:indole-3-acetate monooxygenase